MTSISPTVSPQIRASRTAFLTLRDETLTPPIRNSLPNLLQMLIFSHASDLIAAAPDLPAHEVTVDVLLLLELAKNAVEESDDIVNSFIQCVHLIHGVTQCVSLELDTASWNLMLGAFGNMVGLLLGKASTVRHSRPNTASIKAVIQCLETLRVLTSNSKTNLEATSRGSICREEG